MGVGDIGRAGCPGEVEGQKAAPPNGTPEPAAQREAEGGAGEVHSVTRTNEPLPSQASSNAPQLWLPLTYFRVDGVLFLRMDLHTPF